MCRSKPVPLVANTLRPPRFHASYVKHQDLHQERTNRFPSEEKMVRPEDLKQFGDELASSVQPWDAGCFTFVRHLQEAPSNKGSVDLMASYVHNGQRIVVKRMPNWWVTSSPNSFDLQYPNSNERPWADLSMIKALGRRNCPFLCELLGIFRDDETTYVLTSHAEEGDLHHYCSKLPACGQEWKDREVALRPIAHQVFSAVEWLHARGVAHGDLSLENIVLCRGAGGNAPKVRLIDFGMATTSPRRSKACGKTLYLPPEVHVQPDFDTRAADVFALGIVLFAAAVECYPWSSTEPGVCKMFTYYSMHGFEKLVTKRKASGNMGRLKDVMSTSLVTLLGDLLSSWPSHRPTFVAPAFPGFTADNAGIGAEGQQVKFPPCLAPTPSKPSSCVWDSEWLVGEPERSKTQDLECQEFPHFLRFSL